MKSLVSALSQFCLVLALISCKPAEPPTDLSKESIIPKPVEVTATRKVFELTEDTKIYVDNEANLGSVAHYLADRLSPATGFELQVLPFEGVPPSGNIYLTTLRKDASLGEEGYRLTIDKDFVRIAANVPAGIFHGIQTLRQLLPGSIELPTRQQGPWKIGTGTIVDYPLYHWRGTMLDVARHFFSVEDIKRYIDLVSYYKLNVMHLHLSDDQGWRIEIKSWPNLTLRGGSTQVGGGKGGFYTQEQYADIIAYAGSRFITVVPEIDLPGHINSALASYGELNGGTIVPEEGRLAMPATSATLDGKSKPTDLYTGIEVGWSTLRVEKPVTFKFVDDVINELSAMTPGPYLHIGGDEAAATKKKDYITFINRFKDIVKSHGKTMIGWEEIAQADIGPDIIAQYWHASSHALAAVEKGSKLIMSPATKSYIDMSYDSTTRLGLHWAAYIEVDSAYAWNPSTFIKGVGREDILGVEAPLWSETISTMDDIEFLAFPRIPGYAEIGWSPMEGRTWDEYKIRLGSHGPRMTAMGINFYRSRLVPWASDQQTPL